MDIIPEQVIWFPGIYGGRESDEYTQFAAALPLTDLVKLVQKRVQEDGEWTIASGLVGGQDAKMRSMMSFAADPKNIEQVLGSIIEEKAEGLRTVDFVCRELANASKWAINSAYRATGLD